MRVVREGKGVRRYEADVVGSGYRLGVADDGPPDRWGPHFWASSSDQRRGRTRGAVGRRLSTPRSLAGFRRSDVEDWSHSDGYLWPGCGSTRPRHDSELSFVPGGSRRWPRSPAP